MVRGRSSRGGSYRGSSRGYWNGNSSRGSYSSNSRGSYSGSRGNYSSGSRGNYSSGSRGNYSSGSRGNYSSNSRGGYSPSSRGSYTSANRFSPVDSRGKYNSSDHHHHRSFSSSRSSHLDDFNKSYRPDYLERDSRERRSSPERKRIRTEASNSRYDSSLSGYGSSRNELSSYSERSRGYSGERHPPSSPFSKREEFRGRPTGPPTRGSYRGRVSLRGSRGSLRGRERPIIRRRLLDSSYSIRKPSLARSSSFRRQRIARMRSAIAKRSFEENDDRERDEDQERNDEHHHHPPAEPEEEKREERDEEPKKSEEKNKDEDTKQEETLEEKLKSRRSFVKLECPHCLIKVLTFGRYERHLMSHTHSFAMRKIAMKHKSILSQMRSAQRNTQNEMDKDGDDLTDKTNFCSLCKLNYRQKKAVHQLSEAHKNMRKFLMPECKTCNIAFKSPMSYENHLCSIRHIKRQQRVENAGEMSGEEDDTLQNFTTIDSVGDADNADVSEVLEGIDVGIEKVRKVEVYYCDLCKMYLPRTDEDNVSETLSAHCKQKVHMRRYKRLTEKEQSEQAVKEEVKPKVENVEEPETIEANKLNDEEAKDDKLWADVDKDLGDILAEAESGNKTSDEDEEDSHANSKRYDRFKLSINDSDAKETEEK